LATCIAQFGKAAVFQRLDENIVVRLIYCGNASGAVMAPSSQFRWRNARRSPHYRNIEQKITQDNFQIYTLKFANSGELLCTLLAYASDNDSAQVTLFR
jgi:hypothetical protein